MSVQVFKNIKEAISNLNPEDIRRHTEKPLRIFLFAHSADEYAAMETFFIPPELSDAKRAAIQHLVYRASEGYVPSSDNDLEIFFQDSQEPALSRSRNVFAFPAANPMQTVQDVLAQRPDLAIPLAMHILPFREEVSRRIVKKVARENALFSLATALPDIVPLISLPWAVGEFASDTAVLTANQIRMAFLLGAASDREIGYKEQRSEVVSIMLGAFGWRAAARELVGKIPLGGGLIPKAAIAYAGTRVVGLSLERFYRVGRGFTRAERREAYQDALERGKTMASSLLERFTRGTESAS